jgi:Carboxypeptidase regulatory-like domain/PDZ domain
VTAAVIAARREGGTRDKGSYGSTSAKRDGSYEIRGLRAGSFKITAEVTADFVAKSEVVVEVAANATVERDIALTAEPVGEIAGVVVDGSGAPVAGVDVVATTHRGNGATAAKTNTVGAFAIAALRPGGYAIHVMRDGKLLRKPGATDDMRDGEVATVKVGQTTTVRLVVEVPAERITGTVVDTTDKPIADAFVAAARESDAAGAGSNVEATRWDWDKRPVLTSTDGAFEVGKLAPGKYTVRAHLRGGGEAVAEHVATGSSVKLTIQATGSFEGTVRRSGGAIVDDVAITIRDATSGYRRREQFYRTAGRFVIRDVPKGSYVVVADAAGGTKQLELELREGEARTGVDFELLELVVLTGRIVQLGTTTPVAGFQVIARPVRGGGMYPQDPRRASSDAAGRFIVHNVAPGQLVIMMWPDGESDFTGVTSYRTITGSGTGSGTIDIGDLVALKRRLKPGETAGDLGLKFRQQPNDTPPDRRESRVSYIDPKGPAAKSGIEVEDVIVSIDGIDVRGENLGRIRALVNAPPGTKLALGLARGATVYITLAAP